MRPVIPKLLILISVLLLATTSAASQQLQTPDGTWIGFAQAGNWEVFLELLMVDEQDPSVKVVRMWPGRPGAETGMEISNSGIRFELEFPVGMVRFDGHQEGSAINGTLELDESLGRFSIRRMIDFAPLDFQPYEGSYELEDGRTVYVRRHDNVQQRSPFPVTGASYFLFDDSGRYRRLYPVAPDRFVAAEALSDSGPFFSELEFVRETDDDAGGLRWQLNGQPALSGTRKTVYRQEDVTIEGESVRLEGRLLVPSAPGPHPAVVLLHGLGAFSRNMAGPFLIADYLASRGVAVLVYDKRGVGGSTGGHPFNDRVSEYASDAVLATDYLYLRPDIDPNRIGLLGVSDGARVAAVAGGQSERIAFLVLVSGRGVSFADTWPPDEVVGNLESQLRARGFEEQAIQDAIRVAELDLAYSLHGERWDELEDAIARYRDEPWFANTWLGWTGASTQGHKYWDRYNPPSEDDPQLALRALRVPILAIWGEMDPTFPPRVHKPGLEKLLAEAGHPDYTLVEYANTGHGMNDIPPGKPLRGRGLAEGYFETVGGWMDKHIEAIQDHAGGLDGNTVPHVLRILAVPEDKGRAFRSSLEEIYLPAWERLNTDSMLEELKVLEVTEVLEDWVGTPEWTHLILARVSPEHTAEEFLELEHELVGENYSWDGSVAKLLRTEILNPVPESYYPWPHPDSPERENDAVYLVEYIDIKPEEGFTEEYEALMVEFFGPGAGLMYREGSRYGFIALGSSEVLLSDPTMPEWDQVHFSAILPDAWDPNFLDAVARANPSFDREPTIERILEIRRKLREDLAKELTEYRVR